MYVFEYTYRVCYADIDQMGYMYYGHYARLYEIGRVEALRNLGIRYRDLEEDGIIMPVYENRSRFIMPARYDELLTIKVILKQLPAARIIFEYEIENEEKQKIHHGVTTLVFMDQDKKRIIPCPESILTALKPFFT
jgi:acyl-CoA thioester hydrolase